MRISDWSSDVCSSDLVALVLTLLVVDQNEHPAIARILDDLLDRGQKGEVLFRRPGECLRARSGQLAQLVVHGYCASHCGQSRATYRAIISISRFTQIGRASCRERVCHNV